MIKIGDLVRKAKEIGSQESMATVYKDQDHQIWVGIWIRKKNKVDVFTAASIRLGFSEDCSVDFERFTTAVDVLKRLHELGYSLFYCGNGSIYVERETSEMDVKKQVDEMLKLLAIYAPSVGIPMNMKTDSR